MKKVRQIKNFDFCTANVKQYNRQQGIHPEDPRVSGLWSHKISGDMENGGALLACTANPRRVYIVVCEEERSIYWYTTTIDSLMARKKQLRHFVKIDVQRYNNSLKQA